MHPNERPHDLLPGDPATPVALVDGLDVVVAPFFQARIVADRHYRQGIGFESRGQWERALQSFRTACDLHPQRVLYLVARGRVCQAHGLENEAAACYALARKVDPSDPVTLFNQADLLARRGDLDAAVTNLHTLLDTHGDSLGARVASVWQLLGDLELARRNVGAAIGAYRRGADARSPDPYLTTVVQADKRLRDVAASDDTAARIDGDGVVFPAKAAIYAFAGAMLLGLPDDDGIEVPTYPGLGFISVDEVAQALARPLALFRRRHEPFVAVHAVEEAATPVAQAIASMLGIPIGMHPDGARLSIGLVGEDPSALRRNEAHRGDWSFCLGLRHPAWRYSGVLDGALVVAEVEVPWVSVDARARRPDRDVATALVEALVRTDPCDDVISRHLKWHGTRSHLRAGDPASTYSPNPV